MDRIERLRDLREKVKLSRFPEKAEEPAYIASNDDVAFLLAEIDRLALVHREEQGRSADRLRAALEK